MSKVSFTFLGTPEVRHANQVLSFATRKEYALLLYLAVESRIHLRQKLSEIFWPEGDAQHGRAALRITLLHLRHVLGERTESDHGPHLLITRDTLGLDFNSDIELDLQTIHRAWELAHRAAHITLSMPESTQNSLLVQLQQAIGYARGEFLEGFLLRDAPAFDDWVRLQREYWHLRMDEVFRTMLATTMQTEPTPETMALVNRIRAVAPPRRKELPRATPTAAISIT